MQSGKISTILNCMVNSKFVCFLVMRRENSHLMLLRRLMNLKKIKQTRKGGD